MRTTDQRFAESRKETTIIIRHLQEAGYIDKVQFSPYPDSDVHKMLHPAFSNARWDEYKKAVIDVNLENIRKLAVALPADKFYEMCDILGLSATSTFLEQ